MVKVLAIDVDKERIGLGIKQLSEDSKNSPYKKNQIIKAKVTAVEEDTIIVALDEEFVGHIKKLIYQQIKNIKNVNYFMLMH